MMKPIFLFDSKNTILVLVLETVGISRSLWLVFFGDIPESVKDCANDFALETVDAFDVGWRAIRREWSVELSKGE